MTGLGNDASELAVKLDKHGVIFPARHGLQRVSTHFYNNNEDDIARLASALGVCCNI